MAWVDDRIWCHDKLANVGKGARWAHVAAIAYSSGFLTKGHLSAGQLKTIGTTSKECAELVLAGVWHNDGTGGIVINNWDERNSKRDERRASDRDRKRRQREREKTTQESQTSPDVTADIRVTEPVTGDVTACVEGSEGSEGRDLNPKDLSKVPSPYTTSRAILEPRGPDRSPLGRLRHATTVAEGSEDEWKLKRAMRGVPEWHIVDVCMSCPPDVRDRLAWTLSELKRRKERAA